MIDFFFLLFAAFSYFSDLIYSLTKVFLKIEGRQWIRAGSVLERASQVVLMAKNPPDAGDSRDRFESLGQEDPVEEEMVTQSSILAWRIPWPEEPGGLQSMGSLRVPHD